MKKTFIKLTILLSNILLLSSCFIYSKEDRKGMKKVNDNVVNSCFSRNSDDIKSFFAPNIVEQVTNLDEQIINLCDFLQGDLESYNYKYPSYERNSYSYGKRQTYFMFEPSKVNSTETNYYFSFYYCSRDDEDNNNIGVWNLLIQHSPDGDGKTRGLYTWDEWENGTTYRGITLL